MQYIPHQIREDVGADGSIVMTSKVPLGPVATHTGDWLHHWAQHAPDRVFLAERKGEGWKKITYAETLVTVRKLAAGLLSRKLGEHAPVMILSGNSIHHGLLSLACQYVGIPVVSVSEQYGLIPEAWPRLQYIVDKVRPGLIYAEDADRYAHTLARDELKAIEKLTTDTKRMPFAITHFDDLLFCDDMNEVEAAHDRVGPDTIAKILFTSGSTSNPKGVVTTQKMMCVNQAQLAACLPFLKNKPPRILDWLPWNHVFGGSHNFNMMLANGGSLHIDGGKPVHPLFDITVRNLADHQGTISFNVPLGFANLVEALKQDDDLRRKYFADLDMIFYAGSALPMDTWKALEDLAQKDGGDIPLMTSSWGMTETAPACLLTHQPMGQTGIIGVPLPGVAAKLIPDADMRCELRVKGPNIMTGYFDDPKKTKAAFDDEGYLITGDAVRFVDPDDHSKGVIFDGRISEDFKLSSGTWVMASKLRQEALSDFAGLAQDLVVCGHDRNEIGVLIFPLQTVIDEYSCVHGAIVDEALSDNIRQRLDAAATTAGGSSRLIVRALVMVEPPSLGEGEITDKGYINSVRVRARRAGLVERLYDDNDPATVTVSRRK